MLSASMKSFGKNKPLSQRLSFMSNHPISSAISKIPFCCITALVLPIPLELERDKGSHQAGTPVQAIW
ncbi:hypothetical protein DRP77_00970 [Candidatus Poribacteria bacterium]|nr:MAG: hypothetical protein DRP77_00970 [Candidatus Poribacteria bacterium]